MAAKAKGKPVRKPSAGANRARRSALQKQIAAEELRTVGLLDAGVKEQFGATDTALSDQLRRSSAHGATIDSAYSAYQAQVAQLQAQQQQQMAQAAQAQAQVATGVAGAQTALGVDQAAKTTQTAARYGLDGGEQAQQAATLAGQLGAVQGARSQAQAGTSAAIGLAQGDRLRASSLAGIGGQMRDRTRNAEEIRTLGAKQLDVAERKGGYRTLMREKLQGADSDRRLAEAALKVKSTDSQRDAELKLLGLTIGADSAAARLAESARATDLGAADRRADNTLAARKLNADIEARAKTRAQKDREIGLREKELGLKYGKGHKKMTTAQQSKWTQSKARVLELKQAFRSMQVAGERFDSTAKISAKLKKDGYSRVEINMARDLSQYDKLSGPNKIAAASYFPGGVIPKTFGG